MSKIQKKLKILYLITKSNFGGAQRYVYDLARESQSLGHETLVGLGGSGTLATKLGEADIRTISIPGLERDVNPLSDLKSFGRILKLIRDEQPDIVHLNSSKIGALGALAARLANLSAMGRSVFDDTAHPTRIIFTGHGWAFNEDRTDTQRFAIGLIHWLTIALAHKTIAVSHKTERQVAELPVIANKLVVVHNGVGALATVPKASALENIFGVAETEMLADNPLIVGTLAELHPNKGLRYAVEGFAQIAKREGRRVIFVVLGEGEERGELEQLIKKLSIERSVFLAGHREGGMELLSAFDIFLLPSITEAFPYAILEAGNAGLPVIATAVGGIPEVIDDMESGILIQSKNPSEIARAVLHLADNEERRAALGRALKERIAGKFNIENMVQETLKLYGDED